MKRLQVVRFVVGGLLLLTGVTMAFLYFTGGTGDVSLSAILLFLITGMCLLGPGASIRRNLIGALLGAMFFVLAPGAKDIGSALLVLSLLMLSAIMFSDTLSQFAARPLTGFVDYLYFGNGHDEAPPVNLRLARAYRRDLCFDDAVDECERILEYHPRSLDVWCELLHAVREKGQGNELSRRYQKACRKLNGHDRSQLEFEFQRYLQPGAA